MESLALPEAAATYQNGERALTPADMAATDPAVIEVTGNNKDISGAPTIASTAADSISSLTSGATATHNSGLQNHTALEGICHEVPFMHVNSAESQKALLDSAANEIDSLRHAVYKMPQLLTKLMHRVGPATCQSVQVQRTLEDIANVLGKTIGTGPAHDGLDIMNYGSPGERRRKGETDCPRLTASMLQTKSAWTPQMQCESDDEDEDSIREDISKAESEDEADDNADDSIAPHNTIGILAIPCELAILIAQCLPLREFCNLRRACRSFEQDTYDEFIKTCFEAIYIFPTRPTLFRLESFAQVKSLASRVRNICIYSSVVIERSAATAGGRVLGINDFYRPHQNGSQDCSPCPRFGHYYSQRFYTAYDFRNILTRSLKELPEVPITVLRGKCKPNHTKRIWGYGKPCRELTSSRSIIPPLDTSSHGFSVDQDVGTDGIAHNKINRRVLESCSHSNILTLTLHDLDPLRVPWFTHGWATIEAEFRWLKSLTLFLAPARGQRNGLALSHWLNFLPRLEHVSINVGTLGTVDYEYVVRDLLRQWRPRRLKFLRLEGARIPEAGLVRLLQGLGHTLIELQLRRIWMIGPQDTQFVGKPWERMFERLRDQFVELRRVDITFEKDPRPYDIVAGLGDNLHAEFTRGIGELQNLRL